jgi:hypothetical protein
MICSEENAYKREKIHDEFVAYAQKTAFTMPLYVCVFISKTTVRHNFGICGNRQLHQFDARKSLAINISGVGAEVGFFSRLNIKNYCNRCQTILQVEKLFDTRRVDWRINGSACCAVNQTHSL